MHSALRLTPLFLGILATLPGCPFGCTDDTVTYDTTKTVDATALADALADGTLDLAECRALCAESSGGESGDPAASSGDESGMGTTTADAGSTGAGGGSSGGPGTTSAAGGTGDAAGTDGLQSCSAAEGDPESVVCTYETACVGGRRPAGLRSSVPCSPDEVGTWFAATAHLEAASVPAFERLLAELRAHGAPRTLQAAARRAIVDERRHARLMRQQAERRGVAVRPVEVEPPTDRTLLEIAIENAVEGCVRETWAALLAAHQAEAARDPSTRALMAEIADDETRHAELAWAVDAWLRTRLTPEQTRALDAARSDAVAELSVHAPAPPTWTRELGLPTPSRAATMHRALTDALWAA